jgi:threonine dehydratase
MTGAQVYLRLENLQSTGSFKVRGAYMKVHHLSEAERTPALSA